MCRESNPTFLGLDLKEMVTIKKDIIVTDWCMNRVVSLVMIPFWVNSSAVQSFDAVLLQKYQQCLTATTGKMEMKKTTLLSHRKDLQNHLQ